MIKELFPQVGGTRQAVQAISQCLFETEIQIHIIHLQAVKKSFEIHNALGDFYEALGGLNDSLVEKSFPKTGIINAYKNITILNNIDPLPYIKAELAKIEKERDKIKEGYIQQMADNIIETFCHVIYKLENLQ